MTVTLRNEISKRLAEISNERRELAAERSELMEQLRGLEEGNGGSVDNATVLNTLAETVASLSDLIPHIPAGALIEQIASKQAEAVQIDAAPEAAPVAPAAVIKEQRHADKPKRSRHSTTDCARLVIAYLNGCKDYTAKNADIERHLYEAHGIRQRNFSNYMWILRNENSKLIKSGNGKTTIKDAARHSSQRMAQLYNFEKAATV